MELNPTWTTLLVLAPVFVGYVSTRYFFTLQWDPREPPIISHYLPYVGHILGLMRYGQRYFEILSSENSNLPIFALQILNKRTYIVCSPDLAAAVDRAPKTVSFHPFVSAVSPALFDVPKHGPTMDIINQNINKSDGDWGLIHETSKVMHTALAPGPNLDNMNRRMLGIMEGHFNDVRGKEGLGIGLYDWIRPRFSVASTEAIFGPANPFKCKPGLASDYWAFDRDMPTILLGIAPRYLAARGWKARQRIVMAINEYFNNGMDDLGLGVLTGRRDVGKKYGASNDEISRFEVGDIIGVLVNATPTFFWTLLHIYSDPALLKDIRAEVLHFMATEKSSDGSKKHILDITKLQDACPLLLSTYREVLRTRTRASSSRSVIKETMLDDRYLLKKDSFLLVPGALIHADPVWGPDAKGFNPRRFMGKSDVKAGANRTWGGGQTLCPGRFFATAEITSSVAMMVARFDMRPAKGTTLVFPEANTSSVASSIHPPNKDVKVRISERAGFEGDQWVFKLASELDQVTA